MSEQTNSTFSHTCLPIVAKNLAKLAFVRLSCASCQCRMHKSQRITGGVNMANGGRFTYGVEGKSNSKQVSPA